MFIYIFIAVDDFKIMKVERFMHLIQLASE